MSKYKLYLYEVCGNARDGWETNDVHAAMISKTGFILDAENVFINFDDDVTDYQINRLVGCHNITWESNFDNKFYGYNKKNRKPFGELRLINESE